MAARSIETRFSLWGKPSPRRPPGSGSQPSPGPGCPRRTRPPRPKRRQEPRRLPARGPLAAPPSTIFRGPSPWRGGGSKRRPPHARPARPPAPRPPRSRPPGPAPRRWPGPARGKRRASPPSGRPPGRPGAPGRRAAPSCRAAPPPDPGPVGGGGGDGGGSRRRRQQPAAAGDSPWPRSGDRRRGPGRARPHRPGGGAAEGPGQKRPLAGARRWAGRGAWSALAGGGDKPGRWGSFCFPEPHFPSPTEPSLRRESGDLPSTVCLQEHRPAGGCGGTGPAGPRLPPPGAVAVAVGLGQGGPCEAPARCHRLAGARRGRAACARPCPQAERRPGRVRMEGGWCHSVPDLCRRTGVHSRTYGRCALMISPPYYPLGFQCGS